MKKYSIIIPVCGEIETTKRCIDSINANTNDHEIIIIDNGSEPEYYGQEKIIRNEENKGFPVAVNQGIKEAKGEVIIILNNDTIVTENWLKKIGKHLENFDIVGPVTNNISGPQKIDGLTLGENAGIDFFANKTYEEKRGSIYPWHRLVFFCVAIKREVIDKIGLLDEQFSPGNFEDDDFCMRAIEAGFKLGIAEDVFIYHIGSVSHKKLNIDYKKLLETNQAKFMAKWPEKKYKLMQKKCLGNCLPKTDGKKPTLALVMIVKNEEKGIERAILSCRAFVDEIVVSIDTKTTDKSEEIARKYADVVKFHEWKNDFATARNSAHEGIKSDWILFLDGHEYVEKWPELEKHLALNSDGLLCTVEMENGTQFRNPRIYKKGIKFKGKIHELQEMNKILPYTEFLVKHNRTDGQNISAALERNTQRNNMTTKIMGKQLEKNPENLRALFHMGLYLEGQGQYKKAIKHFKKYLKHSKDKGANWYIFFNKALCQLALNQCFKAYWSASRADDQTPDRWEIAKLKGMILFQSRKYAKAAEAFVESFKINTGDQTFKPWKRNEATTWNLIGECFYNLRNYFKAHIAFLEASKRTKDYKFKRLLKKRAKLMSEMSKKLLS